MIVNLDTRGIIIELKDKFYEDILKAIDNVNIHNSEKIIYSYQNKCITFLTKTPKKFSFFFYYFPYVNLKFDSLLISTFQKENIKICHSLNTNNTYLVQEFISEIKTKREEMFIKTIPIKLIFDKMKLIIKNTNNEY